MISFSEKWNFRILWGLCSDTTLRHRDFLKIEGLFNGKHLLSIVCIQKQDWFQIEYVAVFMQKSWTDYKIRGHLSSPVPASNCQNFVKILTSCTVYGQTHFHFPSISWPWYRAWPSPIMSGFQGAFATGVACHQGTLTLPDTWFRPPFWDLLMLQLLRPNSSNLPCLYSTFHLEYPLVLSRFCSLWY